MFQNNIYARAQITLKLTRNIILILLMYTDMQQQVDSATLLQLVDDALGNYYYRTADGQAGWGDREEQLCEEQQYAPIITFSTASKDNLANVVEPQTQTRTRVYAQSVDIEQFQLVEEDRAEDIGISQAVPRITEAELDNRFGGENGSKRRTDNFDRDLLHMVADEFCSDPIVAAIEMPQLFDLGYTEATIQYKLNLLKKRPSISKTELFYLILDPRITDPFKKAFARYFEYYLDQYMPISAEQSKKLKKLSTFIKHHRRTTAYLCRFGRHMTSQPTCRSYNN